MSLRAELTRANLGRVLSEMDFPSGPWTGFYNYGRSTRKHRMDLVLTLLITRLRRRKRRHRSIRSYRAVRRHKRRMLLDEDLHRRTRVYYRGFREGKGIWGLWELPNESGGFHIWPLGQGEGEQNYESAEEPAPWKQLREKPEYAFPLIPGRANDRSPQHQREIDQLALQPATQSA